MRKLLVLAACLAAAVTQAGTVTKPAVTLELPDGWVEVPSGVLQDFFGELARKMPLAQIPKYDYAFQSAAGPPWLAYPYVLVKVTPTGRPTEHDLEALPTIDLNEKARDRNDGWRELIKGTSLGQMRYDKAANVVWLSSKSDIAGVGAVTGLSGMIPTEQGFVELHGYAKEADFAQHLPAFRQIITSARVSPQLAYQPRWTDKLGPLAGFDFRQLGVLVAVGALVGIFVGVYRRRQNRPT